MLLLSSHPKKNQFLPISSVAENILSGVLNVYYRCNSPNFFLPTESSNYTQKYTWDIFDIANTINALKAIKIMTIFMIGYFEDI